MARLAYGFRKRILTSAGAQTIKPAYPEQADFMNIDCLTPAKRRTTSIQGLARRRNDTLQRHAVKQLSVRLNTSGGEGKVT